MWQEILVAIIVLIAAIFVGKRFWNNFRGLKTGDSASCGCDCSNCSAGRPSSVDGDSPSRDAQTCICPEGAPAPRK
jgi:hypothetical protein